MDAGAKRHDGYERNKKRRGARDVQSQCLPHPIHGGCHAPYDASLVSVLLDHVLRFHDVLALRRPKNSPGLTRQNDSSTRLCTDIPMEVWFAADAHPPKLGNFESQFGLALLGLFSF